MQILMICSAPFPPREGIGFYVWNLTCYLARQGHTVQIITRGSARPTTHDIVDGISIWRPPFIPAYPFHAHLHAMFVDWLIHRLESKIDLFHLHTPLVKFPSTQRPALVTVHTPMRAEAEQVRADSLLGLLVKLQTPFSACLEKELFEKSNRLTAVAVSVVNALKGYGIDPAKISVLGNGVDTSFFTPPPPGQQANEVYVLTVARLALRKGLEDLLDCAEIVTSRQPAVRFKIAGTGPLSGKLQKEILRRKMERNVILLGHIWARRELVELYQGAAVYVHPARYEGLPTAILEAMACGCPVVCTAVSGALDLLRDGDNGLLIPPGGASRMADAILQILGNPRLAIKLGEAASQTVESRYTWDVVGSGYLSQYQRLFSGA